MDYKIDLASNNGTVKYCNDIVSFTAQSDNDDTRFSLSVEFPDWEEDAYVFLPACAYDGMLQTHLFGPRSRFYFHFQS